MSLVPWNPFREIDNIGRDFGSFSDWTPFRFFNTQTSPRVDVYQTDTNVVVKAEIPGVSKEDLNVYIDDNSVRLSGKSKRDNEFKDEESYRVERYYGDFSRMIPLPVNVKSDMAKAEYRDGILSVVIPRSEPAKTKGRKIDIQ